MSVEEAVEILENRELRGSPNPFNCSIAVMQEEVAIETILDELKRLREAEKWVPDAGAALAELDEWIEATGCIAVGTSWHSELRWLFEQYLTLPTGPEDEKRGRWIYEVVESPDAPFGVARFTCSECGWFHTHEFNYCPNCGAKMDLQTGPEEGESHD